MRIVLGLGNPGARYRRTRHNLGFRVIEELARRAGVKLAVDPALGRRAWTAEAELAGRAVVLAKPRTYMNRSGRAAIALCRHYEVLPGELLVVYDDADLPLGRVRVRAAGRPAGHRGVSSLIEVLGTEEFPRVRLGVRGEGRDERDLADYVLDEFEDEERPRAQALVQRGTDAVEAVLRDGLTAAMNAFNAAPDVEVQHDGPAGRERRDGKDEI